MKQFLAVLVLALTVGPFYAPPPTGFRFKAQNIGIFVLIRMLIKLPMKNESIQLFAKFYEKRL